MTAQASSTDGVDAVPFSQTTGLLLCCLLPSAEAGNFPHVKRSYVGGVILHSKCILLDMYRPVSAGSPASQYQNVQPEVNCPVHVNPRHLYEPSVGRVPWIARGGSHGTSSIRPLPSSDSRTVSDVGCWLTRLSIPRTDVGRPR
ncbi:hypothetical protein OH76DRAFT_861341 [Lentinus brumalis]|uniref:Uncharacterized protein n=1 Tax=Lentinus brumalis TaxID=2498619 RepID=A0A371DR90_9APHY|nr:hypothetical protein OH76DRAFT_861341 [Polyporus brumalis]